MGPCTEGENPTRSLHRQSANPVCHLPITSASNLADFGPFLPQAPSPKPSIASYQGPKRIPADIIFFYIYSYLLSYRVATNFTQQSALIEGK